MDLLTWFLVGTVAFYAIMLNIQTMKPLLRFKKAEERVRKIDGSILSVYGEEKTKSKGKMVQTFYPTYTATVDGKQFTLNGMVREVWEWEHRIGDKVTLLFDDVTGELWCEKDLPLMKKQIKTRMIAVVVLVALVIVTGVAL